MAVLVPYPPARPLSQQLMELLNQGGASALLQLPLPESVRRLETMLSQFPADRPLLVPPLLVDIH